MEILTFKYCFTLSNGSRQFYTLLVNAETLELLTDPSPNPPDWTKLGNNQCPHCPLSPDTHPHCPLVLNLVEIVESFEGIMSYDTVNMEVVTEDRRIIHETTVQRGIGSLMGLAIATSGCPHTHFFKPMARYHLPLATGEETIYRATSTYLLAQYFLRREGREADLELDGLLALYEDIQVLNSAVADRLREATGTDSSVNAIILLDAYAKAIPYVIGDSLHGVRYLFEPFLREQAKKSGDRSD